MILNQSVLAGIGNIYADEALHLARVHPRRPAGSLSTAESGRLREAIRTVIGLAIEHGGTSFAGYVNAARGQTGYLEQARVFRREGEPCPVCATPIERISVAGRGTNVCPRCQPCPSAYAGEIAPSARPVSSWSHVPARSICSRLPLGDRERSS